MSSTSIRATVATALSANGVLPDGWTVYAKPPRVPVVPCAVVGPGSPYRTQETYGGERVGLRVSLLMPAATADLDDLDEVLDTVVPALWGVETLGIEAVRDVGTITNEDDGASYLSAGIDCWVI